MSSTLSDIYSQLKKDPLDHAYTAIEIPGHDGIYLAVDIDFHPCLFISVDQRLTEAPLKTRCVSLLPNQSLILTLSDGSISIKKDLFHVVVCDSTSNDDCSTFLSLLEGFLNQNSDCHTAAAHIVPFFRDLVRLFSIRPSNDLINTRQGLWGELFVMRSIKGYCFWAPYWHNDPMDIYDFSSSKERLEVKTSSSGQRVHHITHKQVYAMFGEEIVFASLLVKEDEAGLSLRELINECKAELLGDLNYYKIEKAARHAGMLNVSDVGPIYSIPGAEGSLAFYSSADIPHFTMPEPPGVSQTSFRADLSNAVSLAADWIYSWLETWPNSHTNSVPS